MPSISFHRSTRLWSSLMVVLLACSLFLASSLLPRSLSAQQASLHFAPADLQLEPGAEATIEIRLDDVDALYGIDLRVAFDPAVMQVLDDDTGVDGVQVTGGTFPVPDFEVRNSADADGALIQYAATQLNPREPASGSGIVLTMRVKALAAGVSYLDVQYAKFVDRGGLEIDVASASAELRVALSTGETLPPPPTRTSTATPTGMPTATSTRTATATVEGVVAVPTNTPRPSASATPSGQGGYPNPTAQPVPPRATPAGQNDYPNGAPAVGPSASAPRPTLTTPGPNQPQPEETPPDGYPLPGGATSAAPTAPVSEAEDVATRDPFVMPTGSSSTAPQATDARVAMAIPTLEKIWPEAATKQEQQDPLIPRETFVCLSAALVVITLLLALYIWRRGRIGAHQA